MQFYQQTMDEVPTGICPEGTHEATLTGVEADKSRSGNQMMRAQFTVDSGDAKGERVNDFFVFGTSSFVGEQQLKEVCQKAGFKWTPADSLEEFVDQFKGAGLRVGIRVSHRYSYEDESGNWEDCDKITWENLDEEKYRKSQQAQIDGYFEPKGSPELNVGEPSGDGAPDDEDPPF